MPYQQFRKLYDILQTDFDKCHLMDILDSAMQQDDLEQALKDFCAEHNIDLEV